MALEVSFIFVLFFKQISSILAAQQVIFKMQSVTVIIPRPPALIDLVLVAFIVTSFSFKFINVGILQSQESMITFSEFVLEQCLVRLRRPIRE